MNDIKVIISDIKKGNIKPIYFLMGDEPYFIDVISNYIEDNVLKKEEKDFNLQKIFANDNVSIEDVISYSKRYPLMAERQVVILKEAQNLSKNIEKLISYAESPQPTTVLVLNYKYKKLDRRKKLYKAIAKTGLIFDSKKIYDNQVPSWIKGFLNRKGYDVEPKAASMLVEFLGTNLSKISNELDKLTIILPKNSTINDKHIEKNIGISKDYNNFELTKAIGKKDVVKANRIINHFADNPKNNPIVMTISILNNFFTQILLLHSLKNKNSATSTLGINPYFVNEYLLATKNFPLRKVTQVIGLLREADIKSKGVGANQTDRDVLKELLFKILH